MYHVYFVYLYVQCTLYSRLTKVSPDFTLNMPKMMTFVLSVIRSDDKKVTIISHTIHVGSTQ